MSAKDLTKVRIDSLVRGRQQLSWNKARELIQTGKIWLNGRAVTDPGTLVEPTVEFELRMNAPRSAGAAGATEKKDRLDPRQIIFLDSQLIVLNKPAGMNTIAYEERETNSLEQLVNRHLGDSRVIVVHRIDRETSGLLVFARTKEAGKLLSEQFRRHTVLRRYFALAQGRVESQTIRSMLVENRGDGLRGSVSARAPVSRPDAKPAVTHVTALLHLAGMTLLECRLETGRTHQIRIHLAEAGHPLLGEKAYNRYYKGPAIAAPRLMLHAAELGFVHPTRQDQMRWIQLPPGGFLELVGEEGTAKIKERLHQKL